MILAIDVGNTNIVAGLLKEGSVSYAKRYETGKSKGYEYHYKELKGFIEDIKRESNKSVDKEIEGAIISSVVPPLNSILKKAVKDAIGCEPLFVSHALETGLQIKYDDPSKLGADLICVAAAAVVKYGAPVIVIDIGTATTFSVVNKNKEYLGGAIAPGPYTSLKALGKLASQLPENGFEFTDKIIGTNTLSCMSIGAFTAHAAMIDEMCFRMSKELGGEKVNLVATGGPAGEITSMCRNEIKYDRELMLTGLWEIYKMNAEKVSKSTKNKKQTIKN